MNDGVVQEKVENKDEKVDADSVKDVVFVFGLKAGLDTALTPWSVLIFPTSLLFCNSMLNYLLFFIWRNTSYLVATRDTEKGRFL